jgi:hypothetical protein
MLASVDVQVKIPQRLRGVILPQTVAVYLVVLLAPLTHVIFKTYNILQLSSGAETTTHL